ncbi:MAG TPA: FHA domain-containing protein [Pyrinomonadaceae bacterium]|nr:FHA domain-containing protein [Pyrinomonadaceae bacterium]
MLEVTLTYSTPEGAQVIAIDRDRTSFGRGSDADYRPPDEGLSRLHATVYREGDRVWVVDENSTNGTFVNGEPVHGAGTPLSDGDIIRIGNHTNLGVRMTQHLAAPPVTQRPKGNKAASVSATGSPVSKTSILPVVLIAGAIFIIAITTVVVGFAIFWPSNTTIAKQTDPDDPENDHPSNTDPKDTPTLKVAPSTGNMSSANDNMNSLPNDPGNTGSTQNLPSGKKYTEMSDAERRQYIEVKAMRVAQIIGNSSSEKIPDGAVTKIKSFVDAYVSRLKVKPRTGSCGFSDNLEATYERASKNAPFIVRAFNEKGMDPRIGLYLAMIESEHCVCLQSPTGPLGMFQFTKATAELHGLKVFAGASPSNPDERCQPEPAARAAASYMKALTGRYGTGPSSVPLAIGSYNSGEGGLSQNLEKALSSGQGLPRDFWTLIEKGDLLSKQFQSENFKYVPKFFAAAIIGENPQDFGLNLQPISTYSK